MSPEIHSPVTNPGENLNDNTLIWDFSLFFFITMVQNWVVLIKAKWKKACAVA